MLLFLSMFPVLWCAFFRCVQYSSLELSRAMTDFQQRSHLGCGIQVHIDWANEGQRRWVRILGMRMVAEMKGPHSALA